MSNKPVLFSIIIPTYNRGSFIENTIRSVQRQLNQHWQLIVVNDGSTDDTELKVTAIADDRITYVLIPNSERGAARNTGISRATGDYICFLDSDDQLLPHHLAEAQDFINMHPDAKIFHMGYEIKDAKGMVLYSSKNLPPVLNNQLKHNNIISPNGIFIGADVARHNLFIENRELAGTEDYELWLRLAARYPIYHHSAITSILNDHDQRSMKEDDMHKLEKRILLFLQYIDQNPEVKKWLGKVARFKSLRYSYIALHASLSKQKKMAFNYLLKALHTWPPLIITRRFLVILKHLIAGVV